ncbi:hypothetical protein AD006_32485 (plasmid) [Pseudonocardia sp. EC080610-09]|nr:hypothetical protein AD006_32485 [Pseudonocardia sp. EC080610-09]
MVWEWQADDRASTEIALRSERLNESSANGRSRLGFPAGATAAPTGAVQVPRELLDSLVDEVECCFDHRGQCQAHDYSTLGPSGLCPQMELKQTLAAFSPRPRG